MRLVNIKKHIYPIIALCAFLLLGCGVSASQPSNGSSSSSGDRNPSNPSGDNNPSGGNNENDPSNGGNNNNPSGDDNKTNTKITISQNNSDITRLSESLDNLESLEEMTGVNLNNKKASPHQLVRKDTTYVESDEYVDYTEPEDWYTDKPLSVMPTYYFNFQRFFDISHQYYDSAVANKNNVLIYQDIPYINAWYDSFPGMMDRITYIEETDEMYLERLYRDDLSYMSVNVGINKEGKMHYSWIYSKYDSLDIYGGLVNQTCIEYLEDEYLTIYEIMRSETALYSIDGTFIIAFYQFNANFYEVDLSVEGGLYYHMNLAEYYERETLTRYKYNGTEPLEEGEEDDTENNWLYVFWMDEGHLVEYRFSKSMSGLSMCDDLGHDVLELGVNNNNQYTGWINAYELTNIKQILGQTTLDPMNYPHTNFNIEFENGSILTSTGMQGVSESPIKFKSMSQGMGNREEYFHYPMIQFEYLDSVTELTDKLEELGTECKNFNLDRYIDIFNNQGGFTFKGYALTNENFKDIEDYFRSKKVIIDLNEVTKDYDNVEDIKASLNSIIECEISGSALVTKEEDTPILNLSEIDLNILNYEDLNQNDLKKIDLYCDGMFLEHITSDNESDHITLPERIELPTYYYLDVNEVVTFSIKIVKLGIYIEIPADLFIVDIPEPEPEPMPIDLEDEQGDSTPID